MTISKTKVDIHTPPRSTALGRSQLYVALFLGLIGGACEQPPSSAPTSPQATEPPRAPTSVETAAAEEIDAMSEPMEYHGVETLLASFDAPASRARQNRRSSGRRGR